MYFKDWRPIEDLNGNNLSSSEVCAGTCLFKELFAMILKFKWLGSAMLIHLVLCFVRLI